MCVQLRSAFRKLHETTKFIFVKRKINVVYYYHRTCVLYYRLLRKYAQFRTILLTPFVDVVVHRTIIIYRYVYTIHDAYNERTYYV